MKQLITWTALPNGIGTSKDGNPVLKLSVRVSPRLTPRASASPTDETRLGEYPDFADWSARDWSFTVTLGNLHVPPFVGIKPTNTLVPALWKNFFFGEAPIVVRDRLAYKFAKPVIRSFPAARILEFLRREYAVTAALSPSELPPVEWYNSRQFDTPDLTRIDISTPEVEKNLTAFVDGALKEGHGVVPRNYEGLNLPGNIGKTQCDFFQLSQFHAPKSLNYGALPKKPDLDFHQVLTMLSDYPAIMRALGLVFDLEIPIPAPHLGPAEEQIVTVVPEVNFVGVIDPATPSTPPAIGDSKVALATRYDFNRSAGIFCAKPTGHLVKNGHLDIAGSEFTLSQVDIDGAALKVLNFAKTIADRSRTACATFDSSATYGLPALRSGGMSVLMSDRASDLLKKLTNGAENENLLADPATRSNIRLNAEDITRGYRVDVFDEERGKWYSLCQRTGTYSQQDKPLDGFADLSDEGTVTTPATTTSDPTKPKDLYLHEALFHWDGWSLVVRQPGLTVKKPVANSTDGVVGDEPSELDNVIGLEAKFKVLKGSLPRLRFGKTYRLRARLVDIAGNSRTFEADLDDAGASVSTPYLRFEPVPPPALVSEKPYCPGESAERLVIRSTEAQLSTPTDEQAIRYILAPRASIQTAEQHGAIDGPPPAPPAGKTASWYHKLVECDNAAITEFRLPPPPPLAPGDPEADKKPKPFVPSDPIPYLPDPIAAGVTVVGLPGAGAPRFLQIPFREKEAWPHASNFTLKVVDGVTLDSQWNATDRLLTLIVPKAETVKLRFSSHLPDEKALDLMGIWKWVSNSVEPQWLEKIKTIAQEGRHWMLTPFRTLNLVHAVQRPLLAPCLANHSVGRLVGQNFYTLAGWLRFHGKSTDKVSVRATWDEYLMGDKPVVIAPPKNSGSGSEIGDTPVHVGDIGIHPLKSTGYYIASKTAEAFQIKITDPELDSKGFSGQHELPDTKHRRISYWLTATSRFREYFEADAKTSTLSFVTPSTADRPADFQLDIPSSARPKAPQIEYIIPTFGWEESHSDDGAFRRRLGRNLRVYMSGDWFSSGQGELLGVVIGHGPQTRLGEANGSADKSHIGKPAVPIPPEQLAPYITRWGIDPIWQGGLTHQQPTLHEFPDAVASGTDLRLKEDPPLPAEPPLWGIAVAGHAVHFDSARGLWYADITVDAGPAYYPFVRLALARYQPCSVKDCELSGVVTTDCVQTAPDRLVSLGAVPNAPRKVRVTVSGIAPQKTETAVCPNRVVARAEVCMPGTEPAVWVPVAGLWTALQELQVTKGTTVWSGEIALPQSRDAQRYRIVVEEYELLAADPGRGFGVVHSVEWLSSERVGYYWPRLVYSDAIEVNPPPAE